MKKILLFAVAIILSAVACSDEDLIGFYEANQETQSMNRSIDEAMQIAQSSIKMLEGSTVTRSTSQRKIDLHNIKVCKLNTRTRSGGKAIDTLMYVFNFADNEGFAIIAAPKNVEPLLAITESGSYDPDEPIENGGFNLFVKMAKKYVEKQSRLNRFPPLQPFIERDTLLISHKNPLLNVKWGQGFPEGLYCPNTIVGCANCAAIQIFSYYEYPISVSLTFSQRERDSITINWTELKKHIESCDSCATHTNCQATVDAHKTIGELARQCAVNAQSLYYKEVNGTNVHVSSSDPLPNGYTDYVLWDNASTATFESGVINMIESMGYVRPIFLSYSSKCTQTPLNSNKPILMKGGGSYGQHDWVVDGYQYYTIITTSHATEPATVTTSYSYYNHINWGFCGISNGYFLDGVFAADNALSYDSPSSEPLNYSFTGSINFCPIELQ